MILDGPSIEDGAELGADVCVIGAGPAGLAIASELDGSGLRVCVLESGGTELDRRADALNTVVGDTGDFEVPNGTRRRQFGGTSNMWQVRLRKMSTGARYLPLARPDFEQRDWIPHSGWPIGRDDLEPYYRRAHPVCGLGPYDHEPATWADDRSVPLPTDPAQVVTSIEHFGQGDVFTEQHRERLTRSTDVRVVMHATVTELVQSEPGSPVDVAEVACITGGRFSVRARTYVLAIGAIETARLMLLSDRVTPGGIGNEHDLVGRYFMDHAWVASGRLVPNDPSVFNRMGMYDLRTVRGSTVRAKLVLSDDLKRQHRLLSSAIELLPKPQAEIYSSIRALREVARELRNRQRPTDLGVKLRAMIPGVKYIMGTGFLLAVNQRRIPPSVDAGWSNLPNNDRRFESLEAIQQIELAPDRENRVMLSDELDELGQRRAEIAWRLTELDVDSARRSQRLFADELARAGVGRLELPTQSGPLPILSPVGIYHQVGTARMHADPARGVVDEQCRVHTASNLYVAGGAAFPTGGYANCTLTIVALSLRLADHLRSELDDHVSSPVGGQHVG